MCVLQICEYFVTDFSVLLSKNSTSNVWAVSVDITTFEGLTENAGRGASVRLNPVLHFQCPFSTATNWLFCRALLLAALYREVFDRECAQLVRETQIMSEKLERLQRQIIEKDDTTTRLHGNVVAANQTLQRMERECSQAQNQLDSELESKEQLKRR